MAAPAEPLAHEAGPSGTRCSTSSSPEGHPSTNVPPSKYIGHPWIFDLSTMISKEEFVAWYKGQLDHGGMFPPLVPIACPAPLPFPGYLQAPSLEEQQRVNNGGIFAAPMVPIIGPISGFPPGGLISISHNLPQTTTLSGNGALQGTTFAAPQVSERAVPAEAQEGQGHPNPPPPAAAGAGQVERQEGRRRFFRRFHVGLRIDVLLILKLVLIVLLFNKDGPGDRLYVLLFLAGLIYLYKSGVLTPLLQRISRSAQRAMMRPQEPQLGHAPPEAGPEVQARGHVQDENAAAIVPVAAAAGQDGVVAGGVIGDAVGDQLQQQAPRQRPAWWNVFKEAQMLVVGFVISLLPGFHQHLD